MSALEIEVGGEMWVLLPERAVWWPRKRWLLLADTHWGKDETFRAFGVPLPDGLLAEGLAALLGLCEQWNPEAIWVLGDLIHHRSGLTAEVVEAVASWRSVVDLPLHLIPGNHDRAVRQWPNAWRLSIEPPLMIFDEIGLCHDPVDTPITANFSWAGHLHPTCQVGRGRQRLRLPCFAIRKNIGLLPAFNSFTGGPVLREADTFYPIADNRVFDLA
jgi:DNA ligase-associated metallophosphoesterase